MAFVSSEGFREWLDDMAAGGGEGACKYVLRVLWSGDTLGAGGRGGAKFCPTRETQNV